MKFNADRMKSILSAYLEGLKRLRELASLEEEAFLADPHKVASAKYYLVICKKALRLKELWAKDCCAFTDFLRELIRR